MLQRAENPWYKIFAFLPKKVGKVYRWLEVLERQWQPKWITPFAAIGGDWEYRLSHDRPNKAD